MLNRYLRPLAAVAFFVLAGLTASWALTNVDPNRNFPARINQTQQTNYFRVLVNFNDARISSGVKYGRLPANAYITSVTAHVLTAFNGGSTNVLTVGTSAAANEIIAATGANASIDETSATFQSLTAAAGLGTAVTSLGEVDLYAKYTQTGTPATTGKAIIVISFVPDNDM